MGALIQDSYFSWVWNTTQNSVALSNQLCSWFLSSSHFSRKSPTGYRLLNKQWKPHSHFHSFWGSLGWFNYFLHVTRVKHCKPNSGSHHWLFSNRSIWEGRWWPLLPDIKRSFYQYLLSFRWEVPRLCLAKSLRRVLLCLQIYLHSSIYSDLPGDHSLLL